MGRFLLVLSLVTFVGCSSLSRPSNDDESDDGMNYQVTQAQSLQKVSTEQNAKQSFVVRAKEKTIPTVKIKKEKMKYKLLLKKSNNRVKKWIEYYSVKDRKRFQRFLSRGAKYKEIVQNLLIVNGLPPDLYYLAVLESGYVTSAISRAGAVGAWQFMKPTGRQYGLAINNYVDERVDPIRSTLAAVRYLKELHRTKKSWYLALASYNAGPGRVRGAVRRGRTKNYWALVNRRLLPYDTREYIPQFLAMLTIGQDLKKYGLHERPDRVLPKMELVKVSGSVRLRDIANISGVPLKELKSLNPQLIKDITPPDHKTYSIWVPKDSAGKVRSQKATIAKFKIPGLRVRRSIARYRGKKRVHRIRRGQTLSHVAQKYGTSVRKLKRLNGLRSNRVFAGQKIKVRGRIAQRKAYHIVRKGQHLTFIAKRYGVSVSMIRRVNKLSSDRLAVGQKLWLKNSKVARVKKKTSKKIRYKIRRGDNLIKIARRFGTTVRGIQRLNKLKTSQLMSGQYILVASRKR